MLYCLRVCLCITVLTGMWRSNQIRQRVCIPLNNTSRTFASNTISAVPVRVRWGRVVIGALGIYAGFRLLHRRWETEEEREDQHSQQFRRNRAVWEQRNDPANRSNHRAPHGQHDNYWGVDAASDGALNKTSTAKPASKKPATQSPPTVKSSDVTHTPSSSASQLPVAPVTSNAAAPTPPPSMQSDMDDDEDDMSEEEFAAWHRMHAADEDEERSAPANAHPGRPFVSSLVAAQIPARVESRDTDVMVQIYAPWCGACKMTNPIYDTVAEVVQKVNGNVNASHSSTSPTTPPQRQIQFMTMDGDANVLPGFLTEQESLVLPMFKFFPRCGSKNAPESYRSLPACQPVQYEGFSQTEAMINFLHTKLKAQDEATGADASHSSAFDLNAAHELGRIAEPNTRKLVEIAQTHRFEKDMNEQPATKVATQAPCWSLLNDIMKHYLQLGYRSYSDPSEEEHKGRELSAKYNECCIKNEDQIEEYWKQVKQLMEDAVEIQKDRRSRTSKQEEENKEQ
jgi:thiol-disulfide isomerase/thioredoxin